MEAVIESRHAWEVRSAGALREVWQRRAGVCWRGIIPMLSSASFGQAHSIAYLSLSLYLLSARREQSSRDLVTVKYAAEGLHCSSGVEHLDARALGASAGNAPRLK